MFVQTNKLITCITEEALIRRLCIMELGHSTQAVAACKLGWLVACNLKRFKY